MPPRHRRHPQATLRRLLATLPLLTPALTLADPTPATWLAPTGLWSDPANWSTNPLYPNNNSPADATYAATLASGTATLDSHITLSDLTLSGGTILGDADLTVLNTFTWSSGAFQGAGTLNLQGDSTISASSIYSHSTAPTLNNAGSLRLTDLSHFQVAAINNTGILRSSHSTAGTTLLRASLNNTGTIEVQSGTLHALNGGAGNGTFHVTADGRLVLSNYTLADGAIFTGPGISIVSGTISGNATVSGTLIASLQGDGQLHARGGTVDVGQLAGSGILNADAASTLILGSYASVDGWTVNNAGTLLINGTRSLGRTARINNTGTLRSTESARVYVRGPLDNSGTIEVEAGYLHLLNGGAGNGTFKAAAGSAISLDNYTLTDGATFTGAGATLASGTLTGNATVSGTLIANLHADSAHLHVLSGGTISPNGMTGSGTLTIEPGATMDIAGANAIGGWTINNAGTVQIKDYGSIDFGATINNTGTLRSSHSTGGNNFLRAPLNNTGTVEVQSGMLHALVNGAGNGVFNTAAGATLFLFDYTFTDGATITGPGLTAMYRGTVRDHVTVTGRFSGKVFGDSAHLQAVAGGIITTDTLTGSGVLAVDPASTFYVDGNAMVSELGAWTINNAGTMAIRASTRKIMGSSAIRNTGTLRIEPSDSAPQVELYVPLHNQGTIDLDQTLILAAGGSASGAFNFAPPAAATTKALRFASNYTLLDGATITGQGLTSVAAETLTVAGNVTIDTPLRIETSLYVTPGANKTLRVKQLSLSDSATLDLTDNALRILSPDLPQIQAALLAAYHNGLRDRPGLTTSAATPHHTLAPILQPDGSLLIQYALTGDLNLDGEINLTDYFTLDSHYLNQSPDSPKTYPQGDLNYDGLINLSDYFLIDSAYLNQTSPLSHSSFLIPPSSFASTPEPSTLLLLLPTLLLGRRRRTT